MSLENRKHPVLRGVKPWTYRDEVFCRFFLPNDKRRTNLVLATPGADRNQIGPQIASWAYQRDDGGRAFVFGGLDFRDNLARDNYRKFLLNGIAWAAGLEVPRSGVDSPTPDVSDVPPRPLKRANESGVWPLPGWSRRWYRYHMPARGLTTAVHPINRSSWSRKT